MKDAIDFSTVTILNSPDVRNWPITTALRRVFCTDKGINFEFDKRDGADRWPDVTPVGFDGPIQFTAWLFVNRNGLWWTSGGLLYWQSRDGSGDPLENVPRDWYGDPNRWGVLPSVQLAPGETIGFMVTAGAERNLESLGPRERSNIVAFPVPSTETWDLRFDDEAPPVTPPAPPVVKPEWAEELALAIDELNTHLAALQEDIRQLNARLDRVIADGVRFRITA